MNTPPARSPVPALVVGVVVPTVLWLILFAGLLLLVPRYQKTFADFNMTLPTATEAVLAAARWVANYWYVLILWLPFFLVPDAAIVVLLWRRPSRGLGRLWSGLMIALPLLGIGLVVLAIYLPLMKLYEGLSK
jgi:type II secretory pathway component PulF